MDSDRADIAMLGFSGLARLEWLTATSAITLSSSFAWTTARVMTRVIVPGLAANRISGVIDRFSSAPSFEGSWAGAELARNKVNPIHAPFLSLLDVTRFIPQPDHRLREAPFIAQGAQTGGAQHE